MEDERKTKAQLIEELVILREKALASVTEDAQHLLDISERKHLMRVAQDAREYAENIVSTIREPLLVLDGELKIVSASRAFFQTYEVTPEETEGQLLYDLGNRQWDIPKLRELLEDVLPTTNAVDDYEVEHDFEQIGQRTMLLNARGIFREGHKAELILLAIEDITERKRLGRLVDKHAADLTAVNKELEAFAYSVSHDLRAPLRGIDKFSQILLRDYADKLDDDGKSYLDRVSVGARRMSGLIDALLELSRLTRAEMLYGPVDLSALVSEIAGALQSAEPQREVRVVITDDAIAVTGDSTLLRVAMTNLLANAWKFTSHHEHATIEFGTRMIKRERVYYLRDDGAGFDMKDSAKLFGAFQRLHETTEFPGTGVGLATVQRVIHRHGGRIWAEGEVEKGATFYFTLPVRVT